MFRVSAVANIVVGKKFVAVRGLRGLIGTDLGQFCRYGLHIRKGINSVAYFVEKRRDGLIARQPARNECIRSECHEAVVLKYRPVGVIKSRES